MLSLILNLAIKPSNIRSDKPPEDINKIGKILKPTNNPVPPNISRIAVSFPNFSSPNLLNSLLMCAEVKYVIP